MINLIVTAHPWQHISLSGGALRFVWRIPSIYMLRYLRLIPAYAVFLLLYIGYGRVDPNGGFFTHHEVGLNLIFKSEV
jgi:hypothetical protein